MGITDFSIQLLEKIFRVFPYKKTVCELGDQQTYVSGEKYGKYANWFYEQNGIEYTCIDLNGNNGAWVIDMAKPWEVKTKYDIVTDFGFSEHVGTNGKFDWEAIYTCWKSKFALLKIGGIMINENPLTENWPSHGFQWYTQEFYEQLKTMAGYEILGLGITCAMGNCETGKNVFCTFFKNNELFPTLEQFKTLPLYQK